MVCDKLFLVAAKKAKRKNDNLSKKDVAKRLVI
jgi:hypothetical protein